jgi:hypothetical protein
MHSKNAIKEMVMVYTIGMCLVLLLSLVSPAHAFDSDQLQSYRDKGYSVRSITPVFSQLLALSFPAGFHTVYEKTRDLHYIREAVLAGETENQWTQMITITSGKDLASNAKLTPEKFAGGIAGGFQRACPQSYSATGLHKGKINGDYDEFTAVVSCGKSPGTGGETSESALIVVIKGEADYYTIQWAERATASDSPMVIDKQKWMGLLSKLLPIKLCPIIPGEKAPYPSCLDAK